MCVIARKLESGKVARVLSAFALVMWVLVADTLGQCPLLGWTTLGGGIGDTANGSQVFAIAQFGATSGETAIYAAGSFSASSGFPNIAKWDGSQWQDIGGTNGNVYALTVFNDGSGPALYVGGQFTAAGGQPASRIAKWNGQTWSGVGTGVSGTVFALCVFDDGGGSALYAAGSFNTAEAVAARNIARWNGSTWSPLGSGLGASAQAVYALTTHDDGSGPTLYAGGAFTNGTSPGIARWNGSAWSGVGTGTTLTVYALTSCQQGSAAGLYAGGNFTSIGGVNAKYIAKWDGAAWTSLPAVASFNPVPGNPVRALISHSDKSESVVTVGTERVYAGVSIDSQILRWDGRAWSFLGSGVGPTDSIFGAVTAFAKVPGDDGSLLCIGGQFQTAGGSPALNIVQWFTEAPFVDKNRNRIIDDCDISSGASPDCDADGVPDETQVSRTYVLDNGTFGASWGLLHGGDFLWLNQFTVRPHGRIINCIEIPWTPYGRDGLPLLILVYRDPNNDGIPNDAQLLAAVPAWNFYSDYVTLTFARIMIPPTYVGEPGDRFFIGGSATLAVGDSLPTSALNVTSPNRSWQKLGLAGTIDIHNLNAGNPIQIVNRNWIVRAVSMDCNSNGVLDLCDIEDGSSIDANGNGLPDECELPCPADVAPQPFDNGLVNIDDLVMVITQWGQSDSPADINHDNTVNVDDLIAVITAWGPCP